MKLKISLLFAAVLSLPVSVSAQSTLQGAGGGLQPQSSQTQNTQSLQNQTADIQTNNPGSVLSKSRPNSLSVVSDPRQTRPDAVALADPNLKTDLSKNENRSGLKVFLAVVLVIASAAVTYWVYKNYYRLPASVTTPVEAPAEVAAPKLKKKKKATAAAKTKGGKKRKSKRRY